MRAPSRAKRSATSRPMPLADPGHECDSTVQQHVVLRSRSSGAGREVASRRMERSAGWTITARATRGSPSPTSTARSRSTATCSASSCSGAASSRSPRSSRSSACPRRARIEVAMLRVPGSDLEVELLEYKGCERRSGATEPVATTAPVTSACSSGRSTRSSPTCSRAGVRFRSDRPGRDDRRPEQGRQEPLLTRPRRVHRRVPSAAAGGRVVTDLVQTRPASRRPARRPVPPDAPDPRVRGARGGALPAGRDRRHRAQLRRAGGDRGRRGGRHAGGRLPRRAPPLARPSDRGRRRSPPDDGRDVRQADGLLQGARRLDAHRRPLARHPRLQRHRRRRDPARLRRRADRAAPRHRARRASRSSGTAPRGRARRTRG